MPNRTSSTARRSKTGKRRGPRPGNQNARKHGFYAARRPHPAVQVRSRRKIARSIARLATVEGDFDLVNLQVKVLESQLDESFVKARKAGIGPEGIIRIDAFLAAVRASADLKISLLQRQQRSNFLHRLAADACWLCTSEFRGRRIEKFPLFVPLSLGKNRAEMNDSISEVPRAGQPSFVPPGLRKNRAPGAPSSGPGRRPVRLTDGPWYTLGPLLASLRLEQAALHKRRRAHQYTDRFLLDAILTKLALEIPWDALSGRLPVRACQILYRQLYRTGRIAAIYEALEEHLCVYGDTGLEKLVALGTYKLVDDCIVLAAKETPSWQESTGLLLLQRALFNWRRRKRLEDKRRRGFGAYWRVPRR